MQDKKKKIDEERLKEVQESTKIDKLKESIETKLKHVKSDKPVNK